MITINKQLIMIIVQLFSLLLKRFTFTFRSGLISLKCISLEWWIFLIHTNWFRSIYNAIVDLNCVPLQRKETRSLQLNSNEKDQSLEMSCYYRQNGQTQLSVPRYIESASGITYYDIKVTVGPIEWLVERRYRDFSQLNDKLGEEVALSKKLLPPKKVPPNQYKCH